MSNEAQVSYAPSLEATPQAELEVLVAVYAFLLDRHENRRTAGVGSRNESNGGRGDGVGDSSGSRSSSAPEHLNDGTGTSDKRRKEVMKG